MSSSTDKKRSVLFSVIVPVYRHWGLIPGLLDRLQHQTLPQGKFETILVDNGSPDFTPPGGLPANTRVLRCEMPGSYAARNCGALLAEGEWLVFTDADCLPSPDWLAKLYEVAMRPNAGDALLAGPVEIVSASEKPGAYEIYDIVKGIPQARYVAHGYAATANLAVPRGAFDKLGGFDDKRFSGGDADFCRRAGAEGYTLIYVPEARVDHPPRVTWQEITTKARRVKGGQLTAGTSKRRCTWAFRTVAPPLRGTWHFLTSVRHPLRYRVIALSVLFRVWGVELHELVRLSIGGRPERS